MTSDLALRLQENGHETALRARNGFLAGLHGADLTIISDSLPPAFGAWIAHWLRRRKYVLMINSISVHRFRRWPLFPWLLRSVFKRAGRVVALNSAARDALIKFGVPRARLHLAAPPVTPADAPQTAPTRLLSATAGPDTRQTAAALLRVLARVLEATPGVQLRLHCSTDVLPELEDRVRAMGLEAHVTLLDARPDTPPPPDGIAVIFSAFGEPVDTPFALHALGAGHPIAAARHPQLGDWLKDNDTALTVPPGDETALSDALLRLLHDPALAQRLAANAHARAQARHTWAAFIEALLPQEST